MRRAKVYIWIAFLCFVGGSARADTLTLVNGERVEDVRVLFQDTFIHAVDRNGMVQSFQESRVRSVINAPVSWERRANDADFLRQARDRIARIQEEIRAEERLRLNKEEALRNRTVGRSVIPGWGQLYNGHYLRAAIFFGGSLYFAGRYAGEYQRYVGAQRDYDDWTLPVLTAFVSTNVFRTPQAGPLLGYVYFNERKRRIQDIRHAGHRQLLSLGAVYALNLLDALFLHSSLEDFEERFGEVRVVRGRVYFDAEYSAALERGRQDEHIRVFATVAF